MIRIVSQLLVICFLPMYSSAVWHGARLADPGTSCIEDPAYTWIYPTDVCAADETICGEPRLGTMIVNVCAKDPVSYAQNLANKWKTPYAIIYSYYKSSTCNNAQLYGAQIIRMHNRCHVSRSGDYFMLQNGSLLVLNHPFGECDLKNVSSTELYQQNKCVGRSSDLFQKLAYVYPVASPIPPKSPTTTRSTTRSSQPTTTTASRSTSKPSQPTKTPASVRWYATFSSQSQNCMSNPDSITWLKTDTTICTSSIDTITDSYCNDNFSSGNYVASVCVSWTPFSPVYSSIPSYYYTAYSSIATQCSDTDIQAISWKKAVGNCIKPTGLNCYRETISPDQRITVSWYTGNTCSSSEMLRTDIIPLDQDRCYTAQYAYKFTVNLGSPGYR